MSSLVTRIRTTLLALGGAIALVGLQPAHAMANQRPDEVLQQVSATMFAQMQKDLPDIKKHPQHLFDLVEKVLVPYVDMPRMSQLVLGVSWRTASDAQRQRFVNEFKNLLVRFYVGALLNDVDKLGDLLKHSDTLIVYQPTQVEAGDRLARVRATVNLPERPQPIPVFFTMFNEQGAWKVVDVKVEGISLVTNYRTSFGTEVKRDGLDAVIDRLAAKNADLLKKVNNHEKLPTAIDEANKAK